MKIDLHTHTYFSDGSFSPSNVVEKAIKENVKYLAICDHEVITGVKEAIEFSKGKDIKVIPGIEVSTNVSCSPDIIHIIGLYFDINSEEMIHLSDAVLLQNKQRIIEIIKKVNIYFNIDISYEDLEKIAKGFPSHAHIIYLLLKLGKVKDAFEAKRYISEGGDCYVRFPLNFHHARELIKIIHDSGGVAVLAHLSFYKNENKFITYRAQEDLIKELVSYGIDGIEIYVPKVGKEDIRFGKSMAKKYNLKISCGSDFHDEKLIPSNKIGFLDIAREEISILKD
jgi:predicted metal-dependent phosphoesterase TrpH